LFNLDAALIVGIAAADLAPVVALTAIAQLNTNRGSNLAETGWITGYRVVIRWAKANNSLKAATRA
jgi:hypothetical protein